MKDSPWGPLAVSDAHVHFFSHQFFQSLAAQKKTIAQSLGPELGWHIPEAHPVRLAETWIRELDRHGVERCVLIASVPGDHESVVAAVAHAPQRFFGYTMVNPTASDTVAHVEAALASGHIRGLCFFPAMHRYSMHDDRVAALLDLAAHRPGTIVFVHCGVLSVGVRKKLGLPSLFDMRYSNPIDVHAIAMRYSALRFVIPHFGAGYLREALMLCDLCPNVYMDTSSSNSWMRYEEAHLDLRTVFRRALDVASPRRILFGTDSSFFPRGWNQQIFDAQSKALYEIGANAETARFIFHDNLENLFS
jgi:predicted TIM-barrel fold metal-dependent hydrolase